MNHKFTFEELQPHIGSKHVTGMMLYGTATLSSDEFSDDPHAFYVSEIEIDGGLVLRPHEKSYFQSQIFDSVVNQIQSDRTKLGKDAAVEFADAADAEAGGDPDRLHDERRDALAAAAE